MDRIAIFDTTLRDGEQAPGFSMNVEEKLKMARQLERLQVDIIEAGFPIASEGDFEAVKKISAEIRSVTIAGLARAVPVDIDRCWEALEGANRPRIHTFLATSDIHLKYKLNKSRGRDDSERTGYGRVSDSRRIWKPDPDPARPPQERRSHHHQHALPR